MKLAERFMVPNQIVLDPFWGAGGFCFNALDLPLPILNDTRFAGERGGRNIALEEAFSDI